MSNLSSTFDILRGWPDGSALWYEFPQKAAVTPNITEGTIVAVEPGSPANKPCVDRYTSVATASGNLDHPWLVIQGCDQYDGQFTGTLTCIKLRTGVIFQVATSISPVPAVESLLWANAGVLTATDPGAGALHLGKVIGRDPDNGLMIVES